MNRIQLTDEIANAKKYLAYYEGIEPNCTRCEHNIKGSCALHAGEKIPDDFMREGCDEWSHDDVPF